MKHPKPGKVKLLSRDEEKRKLRLRCLEMEQEHLEPMTPFVRAIPEEIPPQIAAQYPEQVKDLESDRRHCWVNNRYQVVKTSLPEVPDQHWPAMIWLSIKRIDKEPIHDWRELQEIKNMLVGEENEAVELYPAESRKVDQANQYHLYVLADPTFHFPFGFKDRAVVYDDPPFGATQRPLSV